MYWIYLILFTSILSFPFLVKSQFQFFDVTSIQGLIIPFLSSLCFLLFTIQEKKLKNNITQKNKVQGQINNMTKDLKYSYSYIGEINRKLDILEHIALGYPESSNLTQRNESDLYNSIMDAIRLFGKSDEFVLRFITMSEHKIIREIKSNPDENINFVSKECNLELSYFEINDFIITTSPKSIDNIFSCIIIRKKTSSQTIEDIEIMKTLASQALFLFVFMRNKKQIKCII